MMQKTKIIIMGAGAVGSYFGALLARAGYDVSFVARGEHLAAMQSRGLCVKSVNGDFYIEHPCATNDQSDIENAELILITVKSYDTDEAMRITKPCVREKTFIMSIQNGIGNYPKLKAEFGDARVIPAFTKIGVSVESPGVIKHIGSGEIYFGEENGTVTDRVKKIKTIFEKAKITHSIPKDIKREIWKKFVWNTTFNIITAAYRIKGDVLMNDPAIFALAERVLNELITLAEKEGVEINEADREDIIKLALDLGAFETSTYQDVCAGKRLEFEAFTGDALRLAEKHGLELPANRLLYLRMKEVEADIAKERKLKGVF